MEFYDSATLADLLERRSQSSDPKLNFLDTEGKITRSLSYAQLWTESQEYAARLVSAGLKTDGTDVVIAHFTDHETHIRTFWACCLAGIPFCPIPPLHPDESRQVLLFEHLQKVFTSPTFISKDDTIHSVLRLVPTLKALSTSHINSLSVGPELSSQIYPHASLKPDDVLCYMLTSGSTGNSKAVRLAHSNFLSNARGKAKCHNTTTSSHLLNWIAFDHVACISDVHFQALLVDASQYHIAPSAIIGNPRNLLNICSRYRISYTFSPNFLLAQICRDVASVPYPPNEIDLSSLMAFISGGEAVPVKNAVEFTNILEQFGASRDVLRGGFGMTETCAGCIFDTRAIHRDAKDFDAKHLSLGKCCDGVSVRVVNPKTGDACAPLQEGQLQLQGPTVFRGYHNNPKANAESFSEGWFITGDTALLDADGNLHLIGRDKDCININGVKYPSADVENYVEDQNIDGLMKSFVYVCSMRLADANTETYAVFYQHEIPVEDDLTPAQVTSIASTSGIVKAMCAVFCSQAPHVCLPLPRKYFVKTALGKVSRLALVSTYAKGDFQELEEALVVKESSTTFEDHAPKTSQEKVIFDCIAAVFNADPSSLKRFDNLFDMGASSMQLMQLKQRLQKHLSITDIPPIEILKRPVLAHLSDYLVDILDRSSSGTTAPLSAQGYNPLHCLNPTGTKPPLFLVSPALGEILLFIGLAKVLNDDRPIYALRARGFDVDETPFESVNDMAECYTSAIEKSYPSGPYHLAGYSFGGSVAFEIGKKLVEHGKQVAWVGIIDSPPRIQVKDILLNWAEVLFIFCQVLQLEPGLNFPTWKAALEKKFPEVIGVDSEPSSAQEIISWALNNCDQDRVASLQLGMTSFRRWLTIAYEVNFVKLKYQPLGTVPGALMTAFRAKEASIGDWAGYQSDELAEWQEFSSDGNFEVADIDGNHYNLLSDHVDSFAGNVRTSLARAEKMMFETTAHAIN
ncbi:hypothetical protein CPB83DRAFT_858976 [Crepidotus variabilis]|uniref:Carrier domain-containing protein n=1 Tax=Crepidotus variabilis TaxID=179855 RepID=A0A9P6EAD5_9AGAR|nr:hypothetical protein CPB83DRAFT_858976 [Crepidotus variabilis]